MAELRRRGHIVRDGHELRVTEAGRKNVRADLVESLPSTRQQRIDFWARRFGKAEETILRTLANRPMAERDLLTATGYSKSGTYFAAMATLRKAGLLTGGRGGVLTVAL